MIELQNKALLKEQSVLKSTAPSDFRLFMVTVKLFFGISYLSMPNTFSQCGIVGGILLFTIVIGLNGVTMLQLIKTSEAFDNVQSYSDLSFRVLGPRGKALIDLCIFVKQLGGCSAYLYFVGREKLPLKIKDIIKQYNSN